MKIFDARMIITIILFLTAISSGILLTKAGRPLNTAVFAVHKLAALTAFILLIILFKVNLKQAGSLTLLLSVCSVILFSLIIITGGFLSFDKFAAGALKTAHKIMVILTIVSSAMAVYLMTRSGPQ